MSVPTLSFRAKSKGDAESKGDFVHVDLDVFTTTRGLVQANSGGGKSRLLRQLCEETFNRIPHIIIDPEGEFASLRERFPYVLAAGHGGDVVADPKTAKLLCRRIVELNASIVLDLYDLKLPAQKLFVKNFLDELLALKKELWRPYLILIDEAHRFCPERGSGEAESSEAVITACSQGRKRGFCTVLATQRISKLHKDAAAELKNKFVGGTSLDVDVKRAGDDLGFDKERRGTLPLMDPGLFYVFGPAVTKVVTLVRSGAVTTTHPEPGKIAPPTPPAPAKVKAMLGQLQELAKESEEELRTIADRDRELARVRAELKRLQRAGNTSTVEKVVVQQDPKATERAVSAATRPLHARVKQLEDFIARSQRDLAGALQGDNKRIQSFVSRARTAAEQLVASLSEAAIPRVGNVVFGSPPGAAATKDAGGGSATADASPADRSRRPAPPRPAAAPRVAAPPVDLDGVRISGPQQAILDALATLEAVGLKEPKMTIVGSQADQAATPEGFKKNLTILSKAGAIERLPEKRLTLTDAGRAIAHASEQALTLADHLAQIRQLVSEPQWRILQVLVEVSDPVDLATLAAESGQDATPEGFKKNLTILNGLELISRLPDKRVASGELLIPDGLA